MIFQDKEQIPFWSQTAILIYCMLNTIQIAGCFCWFFKKIGLSTQYLQTNEIKWLHIQLTTSTFIQDNVKIHSITG